MIFHEVKAVYERQTGEDNPAKVKETYLVEAVNCADAEKQVMDEIKPFVFGDVSTKQVRVRQFFDIFPGDGENWYEAKVEMITITIDGDKETRKAVKVLVQDNTIDAALKELHYKHLASRDCEILSIAKSPVLDILRPENNEK